MVLKTRRNIECANHHTKSNSKYSTYTGTMHDVFNVATPNCWQIKIIIRYRLTTYSNIFIFSRVFVSENTTNNFLILRLKIIVFFLKDFFFQNLQNINYLYESGYLVSFVLLCLAFIIFTCFRWDFIDSYLIKFYQRCAFQLSFMSACITTLIQ